MNNLTLNQYLGEVTRFNEHAFKFWRRIKTTSDKPQEVEGGVSKIMGDVAKYFGSKSFTGSHDPQKAIQPKPLPKKIILKKEDIKITEEDLFNSAEILLSYPQYAVQPRSKVSIQKALRDIATSFNALDFSTSEMQSFKNNMHQMFIKFNELYKSNINLR